MKMHTLRREAVGGRARDAVLLDQVQRDAPAGPQ
jgi:hypothetical protein